MIYLVDTNVISELIKPTPNPRAVSWALQNKSVIVLSPIVLGEVRVGILLLPRSKRRDELMEWYVRDVQQIETVDIDARSALEWADLLAELIRKGRTMPFKDSLIAASARQHDLTIATRNVADFRYAGVRVVNPFTGN